MKSTRLIDIYLTKKSNVRTIDVVQYDTGINLVFNVKDFDIPSGAVAKLYVQKPSGKFVFQETGINIVDNTILISLENQAITEHGKVPYQVSITNGSDMITTFTGLMMVEKSLKDSSAIESKTVIRAFDEVVSDHVAEFQAKAEQIVQACIATIPEDYTAMEAKVNEQASAIKGEKSGAVVFADDVSPVEHKPDIWIHGKNLVVFPFAEASATRDGVTWTIDATDNGLVINGTAIRNTSFNISLQAQKNIPLKKGKKYTFSCVSNLTGATGYVYLQNVSNGVASNSISVKNEAVTFTATQDGFAVIGAVVMAGKTFVNEKLLIQLEEGSVATGYEPYIDPATVKLSRSGKNLFPKLNSATIHGITVTVRADGSIVFDGTATADAPLTCILPLPAGQYTFALNNNKTFGETTADSPYYAFRSAESVWLMSKVCSELALTRTFTVSARIASFLFAIPKGMTVSNYIIKPQLEIGGAATEYEIPKGTSVHIPAADGTVGDLTSLSQFMTLLTDTEGVIVECEYNMDTKTYIDRKIKELMEGVKA